MMKFFLNPTQKLQLEILKNKILSRLFGRQVGIRKSWTETPARIDDVVEFLNWFDTTSSVEECLNKASRDWQYRFSHHPRFSDIKKRKALEIGFGGGRLLTQSAKDFEQVYGVDIHGAFEKTAAFLRSQEVNNFTLIHRDKLASLPSGSMDFIYSFIVFQHFDSLQEVQFYLDEIHRLLAPSGYAHIYFGKNPGRGVVIAKEEDFQLRDCSLFIEPAVMKELIGKRFKLIDFQEKLYRDPEKSEGESAQAAALFSLH